MFDARNETLETTPETTTPPAPLRRSSLFGRVLFAVPVIGPLLREVAEGRDGALGWFAAGWIAMLGCVLLAFGLPGLVQAMLLTALIAMIALVTVTRG